MVKKYRWVRDESIYDKFIVVESISQFILDELLMTQEMEALGFALESEESFGSLRLELESIT